MVDVYKQLAKKLDEMPNGYPATESGVELKILKKIFTPDEAEIALKLKPIPETVETIAERLGKPVPKMQAILDIMARKGQIGSFKESAQRFYLLVPFVIGFAEASTLNRMTKEIAELIEEYMPDLVKTYMGFGPAEARVIPVSTEIPAELHVYRYEDIRRMIEEAKSFMVVECWCRKQKTVLGDPCKHTLENCLQLSNEEGEYDKYGEGKIITKEEALKVIKKAEEEGLIHCAYNVEAGQAFICACCTCSCGLLRGLREFKAPHALAKSDFVASIDQENCSACGVCADERCQMEAIVEEDGTYKVLAERCIGCGVCAPTCPTESIKLVRKPESERARPPADLMQLFLGKAASRGIEFKVD